jgi:hypothetical protein
MCGFCYSLWNKFLTNASTAEVTVLAVAPDSQRLAVRPGASFLGLARKRHRAVRIIRW